MDFLKNIAEVANKFFFGVTGVAIIAIILNDIYELVFNNSGMIASSKYLSDDGVVENLTIGVMGLVAGMGLVIRSIGYNNIIDLFRKK